MRSIADADRIKRLGDTNEALQKLVEHRSWPVLRAEYDRARERHTKRIAALLVSRADAAVTQREIDYVAGMWAGAQAVLDNPGRIHAALNKALGRVNLEEGEQS